MMTAYLGAESNLTLRGNYVLLRADSLRLLLPQHEVGAAEYLAASPEVSEFAGLHRHARDLDTPDAVGKRRFAALSMHMKLLTTYPSDRFVVTPLGQGNDDLGWCWNEVKVLIDVELHPLLVPMVLIAPHTPVDRFVEHDGEIAYLTSAERLRTYALAPRS